MVYGVIDELPLADGANYDDRYDGSTMMAFVGDGPSAYEAIRVAKPAPARINVHNVPYRRVRLEVNPGGVLMAIYCHRTS
jgi:hypothetical protein